MSRRSTRFNQADNQTMSSYTGSSISTSTYNPNFYFSSQFEHPAFNKLVLGSSTGGYSNDIISKPPKAPEKPLQPYMRYSRKMWDKVKSEKSDLKLWEVGKIIGKMWRELPAADKQVIQKEYESEKASWEEAMKIYRNSHAYKNYVQAKEMAESCESVENKMERDEAFESFEIEEKTNDDDHISVKHCSAARYYRNHRLMQEVLMDSNVVQTGKNIVTKKRHKTLSQQVESLNHHHLKLKKELVELEKKHDMTKRKWIEQTDFFCKSLDQWKNMTIEEYSESLKAKKMKLSANDVDELEKEKNPVEKKQEADFISSKPVTVQNGIDTAP